MAAKVAQARQMTDGLRYNIKALKDLIPSKQSGQQINENCLEKLA